MWEPRYHTAQITLGLMFYERQVSVSYIFAIYNKRLNVLYLLHCAGATAYLAKIHHSQ